MDIVVSCETPASQETLSDGDSENRIELGQITYISVDQSSVSNRSGRIRKRDHAGGDQLRCEIKGASLPD